MHTLTYALFSGQSMGLGKCMRSDNQHHNRDTTENSIALPCPSCSSVGHAPAHPVALATPDPSSVTTVWLRQQCHVNGIVRHVALWVWLLSLSLMCDLRFIHVVVTIRGSFLFDAEAYSLHCQMDHNLSSRSSAEGHFSCF